MTDRGRSRLLLLAAILYLVLIGVTTLHHEPWRDEADAWLAARDSDIGGLFARAAHSGTPPLWYLMVRPLATSDLPYGSMLVLNTAIAGIAGLLVLFGARGVPTYLRIAFVFSYFPLYEYSVIARPYALMCLLAILAGLFHRRRFEFPVRFAVVGAALVWTHGLGAFLGAGPAIVAAAELMAKGRTRRHFAVGLILLSSVAAVGFQLWPRAGGQLEAAVSSPAFRALNIALAKAFFPGFPVAFSVVGAGVLLAVAFALGKRSIWLSLWGGAGLAGLSVFYLFYGDLLKEEWLRHFGPLALLAFVVVLMLLREFPESDGRRVAVGLAIVFALSAPFAFHRMYQEWTRPFSGSAEAAAFLRESGAAGRLLAMHPAPHTSPILPYLAGKTAYYPGEDREGTYMFWDENYRRGQFVGLETILSRSCRRFGDQPGYLILNQKAGSTGQGLRLVWSSPSKPFGARDEVYVIYEPICPAGPKRPE